MALYRRLAELEDSRAIESFAAELTIVRPAAHRGRASLEIVAIKHLCPHAMVSADSDSISSRQSFRSRAESFTSASRR